ncbi:HtpX domain protein [Tolumonas auensis DSM 9187]|jgi:heat shock protein HtpX|uniref:Protease HtpX n=1 Tax=Tolumonas auensis (strain DSM 9187 / NBRC 110442 / TA 4) TaxID=595494 RepID=HTPX_TOLAT|nr:protease HtpX [Tolumonas auensis]C4LDD1.1 RecName: Full=Protease HtpX; AltName: Full=Heat shock protein HtpX [Tolumonas auensis DSM 9187]ACQ92727.1 HtpX domain protein [Tolumonas auensis DSM 9187]
MKRVLLFLATNLAVMLVLSIVLSVLSSFFGISTRGSGGLLLMAAVFGFGGSIISLLMSKWMAKRSYGVQVIEQPRSEIEYWLFNTVQRQAQQTGIGMPEVGIYDSPDMNAFATGANRNKALVAVSSGLLYNMSRDEAEAVLAHEISHVANGDMVTLTLIQGVVNTFVIYISRVLAGIVSNFMRSDDEESSATGGIAYFAISMVFELIFGILASTIVMWFSRQREFRADAGSAKLVGKDKMIAALERLARGHDSQLDGSMMAFGINGKTAMTELFMSHPPLEKRIQALREMR